MSWWDYWKYSWWHLKLIEKASAHPVSLTLVNSIDFSPSLPTSCLLPPPSTWNEILQFFPSRIRNKVLTLETTLDDSNYVGRVLEITDDEEGCDSHSFDTIIYLYGAGTVSTVCDRHARMQAKYTYKTSSNIHGDCIMYIVYRKASTSRDVWPESFCQRFCDVLTITSSSQLLAFFL